MIEKFDEIKSQLAEAATIVNSFKSETVQLRVIDYLLGNIIPDEKEVKEVKKDPPKTVKKTTKRKANKSNGNSSSSKTRSTAGTGAYSMLNRLLESDFFKTPKTIKQMIDYIDLNFAKKIKANDISGKLARLVRDGELTREKNDDKQYEYKKP